MFLIIHYLPKTFFFSSFRSFLDFLWKTFRYSLRFSSLPSSGFLGLWSVERCLRRLVL